MSGRREGGCTVLLVCTNLNSCRSYPCVRSPQQFMSGPYVTT